VPGGGVGPGGGARPELPAGQAPGGAAPGGAAPGGGGPGGGSNILVSRFKAVPELAARYEQALAELEADLYDSGLASEILQRRADVLREQASDLVDEATIESEVTQLESQFA
jgi:spore coat protein CotH